MSEEGKCMKKLFGVLALSAACLISQFSAMANSAQKDWQGTSANGVIVTDEECPVTVEKERLTFDISEFPETYYSTPEEFLSYTGRVTAEYTFYNPTDYTVNATLVFPFGKAPSYGYHTDPLTGAAEYDADTEKYGITVNGSETENRLRYTYAAVDFEVERDMAKLHEGYVEDPFYYPDIPVTKYIYGVRGIDGEKYRNAGAGFRISGDGSKTKVFTEAGMGYYHREDAIEASLWVNNGSILEIYMIGEQPEKPLQWHLYEDSSMEKKIDGTVFLTDTEKMTFRDFAMMAYNPLSSVSETDWYNAVVYELNLYERNAGFIESRYDHLNVLDTLMRWYEYEITIGPGERIVNEVTAPLYPEIHDYADPVCDYTYLLSPAQTWKEFHDLEIMINTPYFIRESNLEGFEKCEDGYRLTLESLPAVDLKFTLAEKAGGRIMEPDTGAAGISVLFPVTAVAFLTAAGGCIGIAAAAGITAAVIIRIRKTDRKK